MKFVRTLVTLFLVMFSTLVAAKEKTAFGRFGDVSIYRPAGNPSSVVLFVSGDEGWKLGVVNMARRLTVEKALIVGIDIRTYLKSLMHSSRECADFAGDFNSLGKHVQEKCGIKRRHMPILVGYSSGATLVYAALAQSEPGTFDGAISLGFCQDLLLTNLPCKSEGLEWIVRPHGKGLLFSPAKHLMAPWIALQGTIDTICSHQATEKYVIQVRKGEVVSLPHVGHGYSVEKNWMPQFLQAFRRIVKASPHE